MFRDSLGLHLRRAYLSFHRSAHAESAQFGVTADQFVLLSLLAEEEGVTQRDLVEWTASDSSTIAAMMKLLERSELVQRRPHPSDRRAWSVHLTAKGRRLQKKLAAAVAPLRQQLNGVFAPKSREQVLQALDDMHDEMSSSRRTVSEKAS